MTDYYGTRKMHEGLRTNSDVCTLCQYRLDDVDCASCMRCMVADAGCWPGFAPRDEILESAKEKNKVDHKAAFNDLETSCETLIDFVTESLYGDGRRDLLTWLKIGEVMGRCREIIKNLENAERGQNSDADSE